MGGSLLGRGGVAEHAWSHHTAPGEGPTASGWLTVCFGKESVAWGLLGRVEGGWLSLQPSCFLVRVGCPAGEGHVHFAVHLDGQILAAHSPFKGLSINQAPISCFTCILVLGNIRIPVVFAGALWCTRGLQMTYVSILHAHTDIYNTCCDLSACLFWCMCPPGQLQQPGGRGARRGGHPGLLGPTGR
jgi:hypothetical protein